jgi:hypothetical protein
MFAHAVGGRVALALDPGRLPVAPLLPGAQVGENVPNDLARRRGANGRLDDVAGHDRLVGR